MGDTVEITVYRHHETPLAVLVSDDGEEKNAVWLPKSQIDIVEKTSGRRDIVVVTVPEWLAEDKGLI